MARGDVKIFVGMGGNFALATPDPAYTFPALQNCDLTIQVSTKLNRSHLVHGRDALIFPCLGRTEKDRGAGGFQGITVEDSMSIVHLSYGMKEPASPGLRSEIAIIAGIAQASMPKTRTPWKAYAADYNLIRDKMAEAISGFECFNRRVRHKLGFRLKQPARELVFLTETRRANFPSSPLADVAPGQGRLLLGTMRSHDQWNTTIYSDDDRYRGVKNLRTLIFMNTDDMRDRGLAKYDLIDVKSFAKDGSTREVRGYRAIPYNLPRGSTMGYMPELNVALRDWRLQSSKRSATHETRDRRNHRRRTKGKGGRMKNACHDLGVARVPVSRVNGASTIPETDAISVEEPLEICVTAESDEGYYPSTVAVTMRTPGHDDELAAGFLFTEGILSDPRDVESVRNEGRNIVRLKTRPGAMLEQAFMSRQSVVSSSCGACGKRYAGGDSGRNDRLHRP